MNLDDQHEIARNKILFLHTSFSPNPPTMRNIKVASELGFEVFFWGAHRTKGLAKKEVLQGFVIERMGIYYAFSSITYLFGTPIFIIIANLRLFFLRPQMIHASDLEGLLACYFYKIFFKKTKVIFNIHDNYSQRYNLPKLIKRFLNMIEGLFGRIADVVLVPDKSRLEMLKPWVPRFCEVIPNITEDYGYHSIQSVQFPLKIYVTGWMMWTRGLRMLGELVKKREDIELVVVGDGAADVIEYINALPRTRYYGYLSQKEAMELGKKSHVVVAFYDPAIEINRYAAPNKIYDALSLGRPIIINKESVIAKQVEEWGCGITVKYGDLDELEKAVDRFIKAPDIMYSMGRTARDLYENGLSWNNLKFKMIDILTL